MQASWESTTWKRQWEKRWTTCQWQFHGITEVGMDILKAFYPTISLEQGQLPWTLLGRCWIMPMHRHSKTLWVPCFHDWLPQNRSLVFRWNLMCFKFCLQPLVLRRVWLPQLHSQPLLIWKRLNLTWPELENSSSHPQLNGNFQKI